MADSSISGRQERADLAGGAGAQAHAREREQQLAGHGATDELGDAELTGLEGHAWHGDDGDEPGRLGEVEAGSVAEASGDGVLADTDEAGSAEQRREGLSGDGNASHGNDANGRGPTNGFWSDAEWIACRDGKARPVEPGTFPLVAGAPARVGRLRAYGNAIVAPQAAEFVKAYLSVIEGR